MKTDILIKFADVKIRNKLNNVRDFEQEIRFR